MRNRWGVIVALVVACGGAGLTTGAAPSKAVAPPPGMPDDVPSAALRPEPALPVPAGWSGSEAFPRTAGTGRLAGGSELWTDYIYDDHGAVGTGGMFVANQAEVGSPSFGTYTYPAGPADGNGADIFRAAVHLDGDATVWRVDWNTLEDPAVPIAEWTFDTDRNPNTGGTAWPANARVRSQGIELALVMSASGARVIDVATGAVRGTAPVTVDRNARSFVARIPRRILAPQGIWTVRLGAGLASGDGRSFAAAGHSAPTQAALYNVAFRTPAQEDPHFNFWNDLQQAIALTAGDVSKFSTTVAWHDLAAGATAPEPQPTGWTTRWYVSSVEVGQGRRTDVAAVDDGKPTYRGRVQPYSVYLPSTWTPTTTSPLTFLLHSLTQNHNQYGATAPNLVRDACESRRSICVTTLGRGPSGSYRNEAQLDFWEVWNRTAEAFRLDPDRTILAGYSMGGNGSHLLARDHPDLFAAAILLAGSSAGNADTNDNLRWVPVYIAGGAEDELVPVTTAKALADGLDARGFRYRWLLYPAEDHVAFELQDGFSDAVAFMRAAPARNTNPGHVTMRWTGADDRPEFGYGTTGAYWLRDLVGRTPASTSLADAVSGAQPDPSVTAVRTRNVLVPGDPTPAVATELAWKLGPRPAATSALTLDLTNVASATIQLRDAGFAPGQAFTLDVTTDGPVTLTLATASGPVTRQVPAGHHVLTATA